MTQIDNLKAIRDLIDGIDGIVVELLDNRAALTDLIGEFKRAGGFDMHDPEREKAVLDHVGSLCKNLDEFQIREIYTLIMRQSLQRQGRGN